MRLCLNGAMPTPPASSEIVQTRYARLIARCREAGVGLYDDAGVAEHVQRVLLASDFAFDSFLRGPDLLDPASLALMADPRPADARPLHLPAGATEAAAMCVLRGYRRREALRLIWRDVNGLDAIQDTLAGATALAEACLQAALDCAECDFVQRHGTPRNAAGAAQRLIVFGLGKLGGSELNFSSDIDLILAYPENGVSDGVRALDNETYFARLGQQLVKLLAQMTADGYVFRVDLRLRPYGSAGRVALSFAAMEQYYQSEGRDWERYAWIKARPVAGDVLAGKRLIASLRPFVYRRYYDYTAFAGLREMKALIDAEVARRDRARDLKLGPGGIREIEFIVQLLQLIRGGREASLRESGLLPALAACERSGALPTASAKRLRAAYRFLRRIENRVQMMGDEQTHALPDDTDARARIAAALDYADVTVLDADIARVRVAVAEEFAAVLAPVHTASAAREGCAAATAYWQRLTAGEATAAELTALGFTAAETLHAQLVALAGSAAARTLSVRAQARVGRLLPHLLESAAGSVAPDLALERLLRLVQNVLRRSAYLALLEERPAARLRLATLFADSALLAERVIAHPLLLDELFDPRQRTTALDGAELQTGLDRRLLQVDASDAEAQIEILQEARHSAAFRLGLAYRDGLDAVATARGLSAIAQAMLARVLALAERDIVHQHGRLGGGLAVIGYGSLGGAELGFASDLDLVFVYDDTLAQHESDGTRPLEAARYFARLAQRVVHGLTTQTHAGRLYEVDVRLRPDGGKGLLVMALDAFAAYQRDRAWIWETQALVRARALAGDGTTMAHFARLRAGILAQPREANAVRTQVSAMRARWRAERDRSNDSMFDLKQGAGALLDIEFILQTLVLLHAHAQPSLLETGNSADLIRRAGEVGMLESAQTGALAAAHAYLLARSLDCTLDARPRLAVRDAALAQHADAVREIAAEIRLAFA